MGRRLTWPSQGDVAISNAYCTSGSSISSRRRRRAGVRQNACFWERAGPDHLPNPLFGNRRLQNTTETKVASRESTPQAPVLSADPKVYSAPSTSLSPRQATQHHASILTDFLGLPAHCSSTWQVDTSLVYHVQDGMCALPGTISTQQALSP